MTEDNYSVKINRRDGAVEITGSDKTWIAEQLDKLAVVYTEEPPNQGDADTGGGTGNGGNGEDDGGGRTKRRRARSRTGGGSRKKKERSPVFDKLTGEAGKKLEAFVGAREFKGTQKQAAIIATFLEDELDFDGIDQDDLAAVYEVMGWKAPVNPRAVINNARNRDKFFKGWIDGRTHLSVGGQNFGRHDSKKKEKAGTES